MPGVDYTIEQLSEMLTDSILKENNLDKSRLQWIISNFITSFVHLKNVPKDYNKYVNQNKHAQRLRALEIKQAEVKFWHNIVLSLDPDNMQKYYKQQDIMRASKGFK